MAIFQYDPPGSFHNSEYSMKPITREEQDELVQRFISSTDADAKKRIASKIIERNIPYLVNISKKYRRPGFTSEDVLQTACIGLYKGIVHFKPITNASLLSYATYWIIRELKCAYREESRTIKIPQREWGRKYRAHQSRRKDPNTALTTDLYEAILHFNSTYTKSFHEPYGKHDKSLEDFISDQRVPSAEAVIDQIEVQTRLHRAIHTLSSQELAILAQRFGPLIPTSTSETTSPRLKLRSQQDKYIEQKILQKLRNLMQPHSLAS